MEAKALAVSAPKTSLIGAAELPIARVFDPLTTASVPNAMLLLLVELTLAFLPIAIPLNDETLALQPSAKP